MQWNAVLFLRIVRKLLLLYFFIHSASGLTGSPRMARDSRSASGMSQTRRSRYYYSLISRNYYYYQEKFSALQRSVIGIARYSRAYSGVHRAVSSYYKQYFSFARSQDLSKYKGRIHREISICRNFEANENGSYLGIFTCPLPFEPSNYAYCCGVSNAEFCCPFQASTTNVIGAVILSLFLICPMGLIFFAIQRLCRKEARLQRAIRRRWRAAVERVMDRDQKEEEKAVVKNSFNDADGVSLSSGSLPSPHSEFSSLASFRQGKSARGESQPDDVRLETTKASETKNEDLCSLDYSEHRSKPASGGHQFSLTQSEDRFLIGYNGDESSVTESVTFSELEYFVTLNEDKFSVAQSKDQLSLATTEDQLSVATTEDHLSVATTEDHLSVATTEDHFSVATIEDHLSVATVEDQLSVATIEDQFSVATTEDQFSAATTEDQLSASHSEDHLSMATIEDKLSAATTEDKLSAAKTGMSQISPDLYTRIKTSRKTKPAAYHRKRIKLSPNKSPNFPPKMKMKASYQRPFHIWSSSCTVYPQRTETALNYEGVSVECSGMSGVTIHLPQAWSEQSEGKEERESSQGTTGAIWLK